MTGPPRWSAAGGGVKFRRPRNDPYPKDPSMKIPLDWLTQKAGNAPTSEHRNLSEMAALRIRMAWKKLKDQAQEGDEVWAFANPSNTWKKLGKQTGYALVRNGKIVQSTVVTNSFDN